MEGRMELRDEAPPVEDVGGEEMRAPEEVAVMLRLHALGWGAKRIAAELGCCRNTVRLSPAVDPHRGLVGTDDARAAQAGEDGGGLVVEAPLGPPEHGVQGALADLEREQVQEEPGQPPV